MPHNPNTTLGIAASNSIIQPNGRRSHAGQSSDKENAYSETDGKRDENGRSGSDQRSIDKWPCLELIGHRVPGGVEGGQEKRQPNLHRASADPCHRLHPMARINTKTAIPIPAVSTCQIRSP